MRCDQRPLLSFAAAVKLRDMAIAFARARYISRSTGGSAARSAAYNAREAISDERTGTLYYFKHRDAPEHHEVLLPEGADAKLADAAVLWNAAEVAERRKDAQVARELVLALPANYELSHEDRVELARSFAQAHFVSKGVAVQLDVHAPHVGDMDSERANYHAHLLVTTRRVEGDHFAAKKARELDPEVKSLRGRGVVTDGEHWGAAWRDHQNRYFTEHGVELRVDAPSAVAQQHVGPIRMRAEGSAAVARSEEVARENAAAARDPDKVLGVITRNNATFTERDLDRHLSKHIFGEAEHILVKAKVLGHAEVLALHDRETGELTGRYTTKAVREQEQAALSDAETIAGSRRHRALGAGALAVALEGRALREDQHAAFDHATAAGAMKIIEGRAGTGKSFTLGTIRDAHDGAGYDVIGLAPTNSVAQDLKSDGFAQAATVHSELFRIKNGRTQWTNRTVAIVDEAAMLDSRITGELLAEAKRSGAKLIFAGDDRQLASIERGGLFAELRQRHGSAEITEVTRQRSDWQRQAARDLAEGRTLEAVRAFAHEGAIAWSQTQDQSRERLVARWKADTAETPDATRFVFAYTNKDVDKLNAELRAVRRERGELGEDHRFVTKYGEAAFATGDRVQFTDTLRAGKIYNGNAGTILGIDADTGVIRAKLDGSKAEEGREVVWSASEFDGFRHGYAGTIYKGQGKTLDHTYLLHTHHWRQASSYVALTRQRESARIFAATETARDVLQLARQMSRHEVRSASVAWATAHDLPPELRQRAGDGQGTFATEGGPKNTSDEGSGRARSAQARAAQSLTPAAEATPSRTDGTAGAGTAEWLIPPRVSVDGRDSFGRGLEDRSIASAVADDRAVQREREALENYLQGSYRDPKEARSRLDALVERDGYTSAAQRLSADPGQLGELRGRVGLFAGSKARQERAQAELVAEAIGPAMSRVGEVEAKVAQGYRAGVEAQLSADATGVPKLSARAQTALGAVAVAKDDAGRAEAWKEAQSDEQVSRELSAFATSVEKRFGGDGVRAMLRAQQPGAKPYEGGPSVSAEDEGALVEVGRAISTLRAGEGASASQAQAEGLVQRASRGTRMKP
jgi:Ti-type conjugative transfer relaxase TraA